MQRGTMCFVFLALSVTGFTQPAIWYVNQGNTTGTEDGLSWATGFTRIQPAIDAAANAGGGEVWVASGWYDEERPDPSGAIVMRSGVNLIGGFGGTEGPGDLPDPERYTTYLIGSSARNDSGTRVPAYHVLLGADNTVLSGFIIMGGEALGEVETAQGGGMLNAVPFGTPGLAGIRIADCEFIGNAAIDGGAMFNAGVYVEIENCVFSNNVNPQQASEGGAIFNIFATVTIAGCGFHNHRSGYFDGGAVFNNASAMKMTRCEFTGNWAQKGGAIYNTCSPDVSITNCLFRAQSGSYGGAICNDNDSTNVLIANCTFYDNEAGDGAAVYTNNQSTTEVTNCVVWGNTVYNNPAGQVGGSGETITYSDIEDRSPSGTNIQADPQFIAPPIDLRLQYNSPCRDTGTSNNTPDEDLDGHPRPSGSGYDMGAYEARPVIHVWNSAPGPGMDGQSWTTAFDSVQAGINAAELLGWGEVWVAEGVYGEERMIRSGAIVLRDDVHLYGGFAGTESSRAQRNIASYPTVLDGGTARAGEAAYHVVFADCDAKLDGFTIRGGVANGTSSDNESKGGGLLIVGGEPAVAQCTFTENSGVSGGAIAVTGSDGFIVRPQIEYCIFTSNTDEPGGDGGSAAYITGNVVASFTHCDFRENSGYTVVAKSGHTYWTNCTFENNLGVAMYTEASPGLTLVDQCLFSENAGGIETGFANLRVLRSQFLSNGSWALGLNGGSAHFENTIVWGHAGPYQSIGCPSGALTMNHCTIAGNASGGIFIGGTASVQLTNSIVWNENVAEFVHGGGSLSYSYCNVEDAGASGTGNIDAPPLFFDVANADVRLRGESPCIDSGIANGIVVGDIRYVSRPQGPGVDMGAFEAIPYTLTIAGIGKGTIVPSIGTHRCADDEPMSITPSPGYGWAFDHWEGAVTGTTAPAEITMTDDATVTAVFRMENGVVVKKPNGGEIWQCGVKQKIRWRSVGNMGEKVRIELWRKGALVAVVKKGTPNDGRAVWIVPESIAAKKGYQIRIRSKSDPLLEDFSDGTFTIVAGP